MPARPTTHGRERRDRPRPRLLRSLVLRTGNDEEHRPATWFELFFDLIFVVAVAASRCTACRLATRSAGTRTRSGPSAATSSAADGCPTVYVAADCVWCEELAATLRRFPPDVIVVNARAARFLTGGPISMTAEDGHRGSEVGAGSRRRRCPSRGRSTSAR